jgi:hypothetical protein
MKRLIAFCLIGATISIGAFLLRGAASPVQACSYNTIERVNSASSRFWSPYLGGYDYINAELITWDGQPGSGYACGQYKQYELLQWTSYGTPGTYFTYVRTWQCGNFYGAWGQYSTVVYSSEIYYPIYCGRQADDYGSYFHETYGGGYVGVYVNQG